MSRIAVAAPHPEFAPGQVSDNLIHLFRKPQNEASVLVLSMFLALFAHLFLAVSVTLLILILEFFGWSVVTFERPKMDEQIEFQLVNAPVEKPLNKRTRIISTQDSRAGGKKQAKKHIAQPLKAAGTKKAPEAATKQLSNQPKATPQPKQPSAKQPTPPKQPSPPAKAPKPLVVPTPPSSSKPSTKPTPPTPAQVIPQQTPQPAAPKAPRPRVTKTTSSASTTTPSPNPSNLTPSQVGSVKVPVVGSSGSSSPSKGGGPIVGGFPTAGHSSGSPTGKPSGSGPSSSFVPGKFTSSGTSGGRNSKHGPTSGDGGRDHGTQSGSPQGGPGKGAVDAHKSVDFSGYIRALEARIRRNWSPPEDSKSKKVEMLFVIAKDGRLLSSRITRSSGFPDADKAAMLAVQRSNPFPQLPNEYAKNSVSINFNFDYQTMSSSGRIR